MTPERWARIEVLCQEALELAPAVREEFLVRCAHEDPALAQEVRTLIAALDTAPDFLEQPMIDPADILDTPVTPLPRQLGQWIVTSPLGSGGMGDVVRGEPADGSASPAVAIKVIRHGVMDDAMRRRFAFEHQLLASLDHPGIARFEDAGVAADGRPWFAMELIDGQPITTWCDAREFDTPARIRLFMQVCDAVTHAHRSLVVHRDLKPGNVLVGAHGTPKLVDFGIGKLLVHEGDPAPTGLTSTNQRLLTLEYAAPEQLTGGVVTTAVDVHALGVLLYELLTGVHPFRHDGASTREVEQAVLELEPSRPSAVVHPDGSHSPLSATGAMARARCRGVATTAALRRQLAGDLDNIVLKALRKEPARRYPSVDALADDLQRHLSGVPVRARPDTFGYRARRFVRRNAGSVTVATIVTLALLASWITAIVQSRRATSAATRAAAERDEAVAVRSFLLETYGATGGNDSVGGSETVRHLLDRQSALIGERYGDRPLLAARLNEVVAEAYDRLGAPGEAIAPAQRAVDLRTEAQDARHPDLAGATNLLGWVMHQSGNSAEAEPHLDRAVMLRRSAARIDSSGLARALNDLGVLYNATQRAAQAESVLTTALAIRRANGGDLQLGVGITANNLAASYYMQQRLPEAREMQALALHALERSVGPDHQRTVIALGNLATFRLVEGDVAGAEADYRELLVRQARLQGREHPVTLRVMNSLAAALSRREGEARQGGLAEAESLLEEALAVQERVAGHGLPLLGTTLERLAGVELARGDTVEAIAHARRALATLLAAHGADDTRVKRARERWEILVGVGW